MPTFSPRFLTGLAVCALLVSLSTAETLLVRNGVFLTLKPGDEKPFTGHMLVGDDGRIVSIAAGTPPATLTADRVVDAAGKFVAPGFVSAHSHLGNTGFRGLGHTETLYAWGLATSRFHRHATADDMYWFSLAGAQEFLRNGITTVWDFTRAAPGGDAAAETAAFNQLRGKIDGGIRFINAVPLPATGTKEEIVATLRKFIATAEAAHGKNPLFLKMALSGGVQRAAGKETAFNEAYAMKTLGLMNQSHFLESPERVPEQQERFAWYVEAGALGPDFIFGHFIHTTPEMVATAAKAGAAMTWQPLSNGRLASGIADVVAYRTAGLRIGAGLDSNACTDTCDPFSNVRTGLALIRAKYQDAKVLSVYEMLRLHTMGPADVLRIADQIGSLEPGKFADFLIVDPRDPYTGPVHDAVAHYVLACGLRNLKQVYVGGKLVADGTMLVAQDEAKVQREVDTRVARIVARADALDKTAAGAVTQVSVAPPPFNVMETTVADVHAAFMAKRLTARQLVQHYLDRIAAYDQQGPAINCIITLNEQALAEADRLDAAFARDGKLSGPLHGIPILVKDEIDTAGMPTTHGTVMFKDYRPPLDAFPIAKLKQAGAIILGKTTLSEFAGGDTYGTLFGASRNPYALDRTVGGSSGGSGGAMAANFATLAVGEETSASLRRPAAWGALAGLRPTPGLISRSGMWDGHPVPTAQMGPMTRTVADLAIMLDAMVGYDPEDPITALGLMHTPKTYTAFLDRNGLKGARIGVIREPLGGNSQPDSEDFKKVDALFQKALADLTAAGATVIDVVIPDLKKLMSKRAADVALTDEALHVYLSRNPGSQFKTRADIANHPEMANSFKVRTSRSRGDGEGGGRVAGARAPATPEQILEAQRAREQLMVNIAKVMADHRIEALAYKAVEHQPSFIAEATNPPYRSNGGVVSLNTFLIHASTITVPMGFTSDGIPAGLAFLGLPFSEPTMIKLAYAYEQATHHRKPPASTPPLAMAKTPTPAQ